MRVSTLSVPSLGLVAPAFWPWPSATTWSAGHSPAVAAIDPARRTLPRMPTAVRHRRIGRRPLLGMVMMLSPGSCIARLRGRCEEARMAGCGHDLKCRIGSDFMPADYEALALSGASEEASPQPIRA